MKLCLAVLALTCSGGLRGAPCPDLPVNETFRGRVSKSVAACFWITVEPGQAVQLAAQQPVDLTVRVSGTGVSDVADGFEFGNETVTLLSPGRHRVEVQAIDVPAGSSLNFSMSRHSLSLQEAESWHRAEHAATESKRTGTTEDITASLVLWKTIGDGSAIARTYLKQGDSFLAGIDYPQARAAYDEALGICDSIADVRCSAEAANNSGYVAFLMGDLSASSPRLSKAASYWRRLSLPLLEGRTLNNLGMMFRQSGDFGQAIKALDSARTILRLRDPAVHAQVLNNLGLCYQSLSENEKAIAYFESALSILQTQRQSAARARLNLGRSYMLVGNLARAEATLEVALSEANKISSPSVRADVLNNLGQVLLRLHRGEQARKSLIEALDLQKSLHSKRGEAIALHYLGEEASARGQMQAARQLFTDAAQIRREVGLMDDTSESIFALAELEYRAGNFKSARDLVGQAIGLIESIRSNVPSTALRGTYYARKRRFFDLLVEISMASGNNRDGTDGFLASEQARARSLLDLVVGGAISGIVPRELVDRRTNVRRQIDLLSVRLTDANLGRVSDASRNLDRFRDNLRSQIELLLSEDDRLDTEIRTAMRVSALGQQLGSITELQAALPADTALLEYYLGEREGYLWVVQPDRIQSFRLPARVAVEGLAARTVARFGSILDRRRSIQMQAAFEADLRRLSIILLGSLAGVRLPPRLVLVLDGVLNRIPMAALRPPWAHEAIGLSFDIVQAPSAAYLRAAKPPRPISAFPRTVLAIADPVFGADDPRVAAAPTEAARPASLPRLPFTGELATLRSLVLPPRIQVLQSFDATPANLRKLNLGDFALLHFSTHALIDDRVPEVSRVALSLVGRDGRPVDGYIHPYDFADFHLNRSVVVLSSCETALGKEVLGEGLVGFANGLFSAGASQLVVAPTKVDAESSSVFFSEVYRRFLSSKTASMESSLTQARRVLARSTRWSDPYYWAPFAVVGTVSAARGTVADVQ